MQSRMMRSVVAIVTLLLAALSGPSYGDAQSAPSVARGFHATVYAQGLSRPTAMSVGPDGRLYVAEADGSIIATQGGSPRRIASVLGVAVGLTWHKNGLYVSSTGLVSVLTPSRGYKSFSRRVIVSGLPTGRHQNDSIVFRGPWMYVGIGSTCDACSEVDRRSASIMRFHVDGSSDQIYARGLRNPYGLAFRSQNGQLYATDNGRDDFGNSVPDELNAIVQGGAYGWPDCWGNGGGTNCQGTIGAVALFEPHSSADGLVFYTGRAFPAAYRGDAFVTEFGQTVGSGSSGHRVKRVHFTGNRTAVSDFVTGLTNPLAIAVGRDGSLLVGDYGTGIIWAVRANK